MMMTGPAPDPEAEARISGLKLAKPAQPASIPELRHRAVQFATGNGAGDKLASDVALAVSEAVTNVVKYAYAGGEAEGMIELAASADGGWLEISVRDRGEGFGEGSSDGLGLGLAIIARICADLKIVQDGAGTEVQMRFALA
jgi:serine/threonine-protein kinase RsbW